MNPAHMEARKVTTPQTSAGGYYVFVGIGSLIRGEEELPLWSMVVVEPNEEKFEIRAGAKGVEALVLQYTHEER